MTETDPRMSYSAVLGLGLGALAYSMHWASGAHPLLFAAPPAAAMAGYFLLDSWRTASGRERYEPLVSYGVVVVFAAVLFGWFFAASALASQLAALLCASLLLPVLVAWVLDRNTLKGDVDASVSEAPAAELD
jgi:hypothetical protein